MSKNRIGLLVGVCVFVVVGGLAYFRSDPGKSPVESGGRFEGTVKVGHLVALDMAPLFVAKEAGFFQEEGIEDIELSFFPNPGDNNAALVGGSLQFSINPFTLPYLGANSGAPFRIISSAGGLGIIEVVIQGKYEVEGLEQFATWIKEHPTQKLKVGTLRGDTLEMILTKALADHDLDYDDVEMVWFNDLLAMVEAFKNKEIDVLSHIKPYTSDLIVNYGAKSITNNSEIWGEGTPNCTLAVMQDFYDKYPETVRAYLRAVYRAFQLIVDDPERAVSLLSKGNYYKVDDAVLLSAFKNQPKKVLLEPNVEGMMICINDLVRLGYIDGPNEDILRLDRLREAREEVLKPKGE